MDPVAVLAMVLAGLGWGGYSVIGRTAGPALAATAASFALALPLCGLVLWFFPLVPEPLFTPFGVLLAVLSGALTSALGYALWYRVLPQITASVAGVAQLVVPVLAMMGGGGFAGRGSDPEFHPCLCTGFGRDCNGIETTSSGAALVAV